MTVSSIWIFLDNFQVEMVSWKELLDIFWTSAIRIKVQWWKKHNRQSEVWYVKIFFFTCQFYQECLFLSELVMFRWLFMITKYIFVDLVLLQINQNKVHYSTQSSFE